VDGDNVENYAELLVDILEYHHKAEQMLDKFMQLIDNLSKREEMGGIEEGKQYTVYWLLYIIINQLNIELS